MRVDAAGRFWFAQLEREAGVMSCSIALSEDHGETWQHAVEGIDCVDKEWIAVGDQAIYIAAHSGIWRYATNSPYDLLASVVDPEQLFGLAFAGYVDEQGAHFVRMNNGTSYDRVVWNGEGTPQSDDGPIAGNPIEGQTGVQRTSIAIGRTGDGVPWVVT